MQRYTDHILSTNWSPPEVEYFWYYETGRLILRTNVLQYSSSLMLSTEQTEQWWIGIFSNYHSPSSPTHTDPILVEDTAGSLFISWVPILVHPWANSTCFTGPITTSTRQSVRAACQNPWWLPPSNPPRGGDSKVATILTSHQQLSSTQLIMTDMSTTSSVVLGVGAGRGGLVIHSEQARGLGLWASPLPTEYNFLITSCPYTQRIMAPRL